MLTLTPAPETVLRDVIVEVAQLPNEDLPLVAAFVAALKQRRAAPPDLAALRAEVQRKAAALANTPREQLATEFLQIVEDLRAEAQAKGVTLPPELSEA